MAKYKIVKTEEVPNNSSNGDMRMMGTALGSEQIAISYRKFPVGYDSPRGHTHSELDEIVFVFRGTLRLRLDDDVLEVEPDTAVLIPPEVKRGYHNEGDEPVELIVASARTSAVGDNGGTPDPQWWDS